ncbi:hypothetical protein Tco_0503406 [Tanacetum coccineum]
MIREYKAIKEKEDPGVFVLPIRLEGRVDTHRLADTSSNINIIPYRIFEELWREHVKLVSHNVSILNHYEVEPIGMLKDVLCQVGVTTVLASFLILDMPVGRTVPIIVGRSKLTKAQQVNYNVYVSAKEAEENENVELVKKTTLNEETMVDEVDELEFADSIIVNQEGPDTRLAPESHKESPEADTLFHTPRSSRIDLSSEKAPITELIESSTPSHS